jgi:hypothetical protein
MHPSVADGGRRTDRLWGRAVYERQEDRLLSLCCPSVRQREQAPCCQWEGGRTDRAFVPSAAVRAVRHPAWRRGGREAGEPGRPTRKAATGESRRESPTPLLHRNLRVLARLPPAWWCAGGPRARGILPVRPRLRHSRPTSRREPPSCRDGGRGDFCKTRRPPRGPGRGTRPQFLGDFCGSAAARGVPQGDLPDRISGVKMIAELITR